MNYVYIFHGVGYGSGCHASYAGDCCTIYLDLAVIYNTTDSGIELSSINKMRFIIIVIIIKSLLCPSLIKVIMIMSYHFRHIHVL